MVNHFDTMKDKVLDNRYKLEEKIGTGGMADVYKGKDLLLERTVAVKILHPGFASDDAFVSRFKGEAQAAGKLSHPHILNMYDVGFDQGHHYIVMEYVPGQTLKEYIKKHGKLSVDNAVKIAIAIAEGLEQAHAMGIVHCDIKPHNILIMDNGNIKVTDFGIARAINSSQTLMYATSVMGSAHYLSPEQASGKPINGASDIYSLGVVLYEMLTGRVPYEGDSPISVALKHVRERCVPPSKYNTNIPPLLEAAILKALEKEPLKRFQSISEMISDLRLSLGFGTGGKSPRLAPYDFATQVLPPIKSQKATDVGRVEEEEEQSKAGFLDIVTRIPQRIIVIGSVVLFLIAFLWAYFSFGNFWSNATVTVPNVVGKQVAVAENILSDHHLKVMVNEVSNSDVPVGQVISMTPEAGSAVKEMRIIRLVVSKGGGDISMPDLKGMKLEDAKNTLSALGISISSIETKTDSSMDDNIVLDQTPKAFGKISKGDSIRLVVNKKSAKQIQMPKIVGMTIKDAKSLLADLKLNININGDGDDNAIITDQAPPSGSPIFEGSNVIVNGAKKVEEKPDNGTVKGTVDITVPEGPKKQTVKIVIIDKDGRRVVYDNTQKPGDHIVREVSGSGSVRVQVYINNNLVQDQIL